MKVPLPGMPGGPDPMKTLTPTQKRLLKEVQAKYGSPLKSAYSYTVLPGEQTHDIRLN